MIVKKIISGAQTGADRAALDFAIDSGIPHGGWVPKGRKAEDGVIPDKYSVREAPTAHYARRTELNVIDSDGTLIISHGPLTGGSAKTMAFAVKHNKPRLHIDLEQTAEFLAAVEINHWINKNGIEILNIAGPRASHDPNIYDATVNVLETIAHIGIIEENMPDFINPPQEMKHGIKTEKRPKTVEEAIERLTTELTLRQKVRIASLGEDELDALYYSLGAHIRQNFGLEDGNSKLLESCRKAAGEKDFHEDDVPLFIIRQLWERLRATHPLRIVKG